MNSQQIKKFLDEYSAKNTDGVYLFEVNHKTRSFEKTYLSIRRKENRLFDLETVKQLPYTKIDHQYEAEWKIRATDAKRLKVYLQKIIKTKFQNASTVTIVDLGCGNGWLSNFLSELPKINIVSIDINLVELHQAVKLKSTENQFFIYADIHKTMILPASSIDIVILNSSFQYFQSFTSLFQDLESLLKSEYEIHILDTQFYNRDKVKNARKRSFQYYNKNKENKMIEYYYHHTLDEFDNFEFKMMYNPNSAYNKIQGKIKQISPFPWVKISEKKK